MMTHPLPSQWVMGIAFPDLEALVKGTPGHVGSRTKGYTLIVDCSQVPLMCVLHVTVGT